MKTSFGTLCTLDITHAYYGGASRDFSFLIPDATARVLRQARMLAKVIDGRLYILFEKGAAGGAFIPAAGSVIRIALKQNSPFFANFTELGFDTRSAVAVYSNAADPTKLGPLVAASLSGPILAHALKTKQGAVDVALTTAGGAQLAAVQVPAAADRPVVSFDLTERPPGMYRITEEAAGAAAEKATYFVDPELVREAVFGIVELAVDEAFYAAPAAFTIAFAAREETLTYYIVTRNLPAGDFEKLRIEDAGEPERDKVAFSDRIAEADLTNAEKQLIGVLPERASAQIAVFRSKQPVKRRARGYGRIELKKNGDAIIENLPQAGVERPTADLIFLLEKPKPKVP